MSENQVANLLRKNSKEDLIEMILSEREQYQRLLNEQTFITKNLGHFLTIVGKRIMEQDFDSLKRIIS